MSGITPILDTLLHQVLGRPVDFAQRRELNQPVKPLQPGTAAQAPHSDSRLDPRSGAALSVSRPAPQGAPASPVQSPVPSPEAPASSQTHFSTAARTISTLLARFPAPPSVLRAQAPLQLSPAGSAEPAELAARLQASVEESGLFYESHLRRWYRGALERERLERDPQMVRAGGRAEQGVPVSEALQGVVRHQLELLAAPVLRWEGDVCPGLFMALVLNLPRGAGEGERHPPGDPEEGGGEVWRSELVLDVAGLGQLQVSLQIHREQLSLSFVAPSEEARAQLAGHRAGLEARLARCGFESVVLELALAGEAGE